MPQSKRIAKIQNVLSQAPKVQTCKKLPKNSMQGFVPGKRGVQGRLDATLTGNMVYHGMIKIGTPPQSVRIVERLHEDPADGVGRVQNRREPAPGGYATVMYTVF